MFSKGALYDGPQDSAEVSRRRHRRRAVVGPAIGRGASQGQDYAREVLGAPQHESSFNQSAMLVTVETDIGITGIGEGGSTDLVAISPAA